MYHFALVLEPFLDIVARGGGGGSGGGGGGGSGGGGGGSAIALIGYLPAYYTTKLCHKMMPSAPAAIIGGTVGMMVTSFMFALSGGIGFIVGIGAAIGVWSGITDLHGKVIRKARVSKKSIQNAAAKDPIWQEESLKARVSELYQSFQADWSTFNVEHMKTYLAPHYFEHVQLMMKAMYQMGRQNKVGEPKLLDSQVIEVGDATDNDDDKFTAYIKGQAHDQLIEMKTGEVIYTDNSSFEEFWRFDRKGSTWILEGIDQATANAWSQDNKLKSFAAANNMFYSLDWGWLLLPKRGQLFGKANFKNSDINNHVIGEWDGLLVQLYTYIPAKSNSGAQNNLIAQINLPKSYGGIIIRRRSWWRIFSRKPKGYNKISFEWPDFNKRYTVYATDVDQVTSFELLNPAFMAELHDYNLPINIEVVDNIVYLYAVASNPQNRYEPMMAVLKRAFKELKR